MVSELPGKIVTVDFTLPPSEWRLTMRASPYFLGNFYDMQPVERFGPISHTNIARIIVFRHANGARISVFSHTNGACKPQILNP